MFFQFEKKLLPNVSSDFEMSCALAALLPLNVNWPIIVEAPPLAATLNKDCHAFSIMMLQCPLVKR